MLRRKPCPCRYFTRTVFAQGGAVVRALASHQCGPGSTTGVDAICRLSLLLVLSLAPRGFSPGSPVFPSPQKPTLPNSNSIWNARTRLNEFIYTPICFVVKQAIYNFNFFFAHFIVAVAVFTHWAICSHFICLMSLFQVCCMCKVVFLLIRPIAVLVAIAVLSMIRCNFSIE